MSIRLENVSKTYGSFKALDDVSVEFAEGELTALLGPSGSGKTTLLRMIAGLEEPDEIPPGKVLFDGEDVADKKAGRRKIGFVFQHYALFRHLSVFENVAFGLRVMKRKDRPSEAEIERRVGELLGLVQLEAFRGRRPSQLSGGQRQRVALARALAIRPKVLLLDEPFGALDAKVRGELRKWIRKLHDELRITSVFVTHDQEEALEVADRIVLTNKGRIEQTGTPEEVFHDPANEFVMRFLGEVNVFRGRSGAAGKSVPSSESSRRGNGYGVIVRPHDFTIGLEERSGEPQFPACVLRVRTAGPVVKVDLVDEGRQEILVHLSHNEFGRLSLIRGQRVFLVPRRMKTYPGGEGIKRPQDWMGPGYPL